MSVKYCNCLAKEKKNHGIFRDKIILPAAFGIRKGHVTSASSFHGSFSKEQK